MIITAFVVFLALSIILIITGVYAEIPPVLIAGYVFMFALGVLLAFGGLEYKSGEYTTIPAVNETNMTYQYQNYDSELIPNTDIKINHLFGFLLSVLGIIGFIDVNIKLKGLQN